jgi:hypothetical protein
LTSNSFIGVNREVIDEGGVRNPSNNATLVQKKYVDDQIATRIANGSSLSALTSPTSDIAFGGFKITNLADPLNGKDATNKEWVLS